MAGLGLWLGLSLGVLTFAILRLYVYVCKVIVIHDRGLYSFLYTIQGKTQ